MTLSIKNLVKILLQATYSPRGFLWQLPARHRAVALTFDDGPDPVYTPAVLDLLAAHRIKASFFVIGEKAEQYPEIVRRIAAEGHAIGGHTWSHREIVGLPTDELASELNRCRQIIRDMAGVDTVLFRPPRGRVDISSIHRVCKQGYCLVHWTKTYSDYQREGTEPLLDRFRQNEPVARDIVLLHDHNEHTIAALNMLIPQWLAKGIAFIKMPENAAW